MKQSLSLYESGDLGGALKLMREAYRLSERPELLYNLARLERELKDCPTSRADYRGYLQRVPDGDYRAEAEQAAGELDHECPAPSAPPNPVASPAPNPVPAQPGPTAQSVELGNPLPPTPTNRDAAYWTPTRVVGWTAIASGAVAEGGMLYFWLAGKRARDDFQKVVTAYRAGPLDTSPRDRQHRDIAAAQVLGVAGGALVAGGVLVLMLNGHDRNPSPASAFLYLPPSGIGAGYAQSF